jgi:hypothetical protein
LRCAHWISPHQEGEKIYERNYPLDLSLTLVRQVAIQQLQQGPQPAALLQRQQVLKPFALPQRNGTLHLMLQKKLQEWTSDELKEVSACWEETKHERLSQQAAQNQIHASQPGQTQPQPQALPESATARLETEQAWMQSQQRVLG